MIRKEFQELTRTLVLLDGATGSNLLAQGMPRGVCAELWITEHKDVITALQKAYAEAGSRIIYAPTFGANRMNLSKYGAEDRIRELNFTLVSYAREAAGNSAFVAGDITTAGTILSPENNYTYEMAFENYCEQIRLLNEAGADCIVAETMISIEEALAAADACHAVCSLPILCTMTVEADGSIFTGGNAVEAAAALESAGADAVGVNCSVGPDQLVSVIRSIRENVSIPVIAKPNAGMPFIDDEGHAVYTMTPGEFARHMKILMENGASIIGGCCGTTPEYIRAIKAVCR